MKLADCYNVEQFRRLAQRRLPAPVFHYIDGAADDEVTYRRNTACYESCDLVPSVLAGCEAVDLKVNVLGQQIELPIFLSPTALQRLFHWQGERAVAQAASHFGTYFGVSSLATVSVDEIGAAISTPKLFQLYYHKDKALTFGMIDRCKAAGFDALALTVDTIVGGNRERDLRTGFTSPPKLTLGSAFSFVTHPRWTWNYLFRERFSLPQLEAAIAQGSNIAVSVSDYFSNMLDRTMTWDDAAAVREAWDGPFCLKGVMSVDDAKRAVDIGASAIMISNHGGRQLDGSRAPFDQLKEIVDAVGGQIEVICDGGIRRGTHVLKALALGATACSGGRWYLYALAAAGQAGVEKTLENMRAELERDLRLMGVSRVADLNEGHLRFR